MRRILIVIFLLLLIPAVGHAQEDEDPRIAIVDVSGPMDRSALAFLAESIRDSASRDMELVVLQLSSPAALDGPALRELSELIALPPVPVAVWVGPGPAQAHGGVGQLVLRAEHGAIAPGSTIGILEPTVAGEPDADPVFSGPPQPMLHDPVPAEDSGLDLQPTIRQYLQELNGQTFETVSGPLVVETVEEITVDGETGVTVKPHVFSKPGLATRFFRLAVMPEAAFFFLVVGLSIITFEFFAMGPGVAAGVAAISLILGGWGIANLPVRPWALGLAILGWLLLTASYQRGGAIVMTSLGAVFLLVAGSFYVEGSGQIDPRWWLVLPSVLSVLFFFLLAMPTVQRARFSTQVLGRESLVGASGRALEPLNPDGVVEVNQARWRATSHREAGIEEGDAVEVTGVDGLFLEVQPVRPSREI